jgi:hypothetical protein
MLRSSITLISLLLTPMIAVAANDLETL